MKAIVIDKFCDTLDQVCVSEVPTPEATGDNVLIRVRGVGVNYVDTLYVSSLLGALMLLHLLTR